MILLIGAKQNVIENDTKCYVRWFSGRFLLFPKKQINVGSQPGEGHTVQHLFSRIILQLPPPNETLWATKQKSKKQDPLTRPLFASDAPLGNP